MRYAWLWVDEGKFLMCVREDGYFEGWRRREKGVQRSSVDTGVCGVCRRNLIL